MKKWRKTRKTFRHGNLPEALVDAALGRLENGGIESLSLRELARDIGVNHRAVYRYFPDKLSLQARVAQEGWRHLERQVSKEKFRTKDKNMLVTGALGFFRFARKHPSLFHLMAGPRINAEGAFPDLDRSVGSALKIFMQAFIDAGTSPKFARERTVIFVAALTGVVQQVLHKRLRVTPARSGIYIADTTKMLLKGLR